MSEKRQRLIFHCDCNNFFASCECLDHPELKNVPMAVAGNPENRTGIVVAKNELAKKCGVKTTDTVWAAKKKCPGVVFMPPRHKLYEEISARVNEIYHGYTDFMEPASIDESYLDLTGAPEYYGVTPRDLADTLRNRVRDEIGITISVGVSFNKIFAKMGSDYKKPDATTVITEENYRDVLWPLPVSDLIFAGHAAVELLKKKYVNTVGDLARRNQKELIQLLGKSGGQLWSFANGLDREPVRRFGDPDEVKSVSRGMTFKRDLVMVSDVHMGLAALVDDVAMSLRRQNLQGSVVQVQIKSPDLSTISRQMTLTHPTFLQHEIQQVAIKLVEKHWRIGPTAPIRAMTVGLTHLVPTEEIVEQLNLFDTGLENPSMDGKVDRARQERLEAAVDLLRQRHGAHAISLGFRENEEIGLVKPDRTKEK
jgi:DNA polymerase-4